MLPSSNSSMEEFWELLRSSRNNPPEEKQKKILRAAKLFEQRVFHYTVDGEVLFEPEEYLSYEEALEKASNIQPVGYDRFNPTGAMNPEIFLGVRNYLPNFLSSSLELIITIGTEFDYFHGGDAVLRISYKGFSASVSLDATINDNKVSLFKKRQRLEEISISEDHLERYKNENEALSLRKELKCDFLIYPDGLEEERFLQKIYPEVARLLVSRLINKIEGLRHDEQRISISRAIPE